MHYWISLLPPPTLLVPGLLQCYWNTPNYFKAAKWLKRGGHSPQNDHKHTQNDYKKIQNTKTNNNTGEEAPNHHKLIQNHYEETQTDSDKQLAAVVCCFSHGVLLICRSGGNLLHVCARCVIIHRRSESRCDYISDYLGCWYWYVAFSELWWSVYFACQQCLVEITRINLQLV